MSQDDNPTSNGAAKKGNNEETKWTIMAYLAGDNSLADECVYALTEMKAAKTGGRIKIIAQLDPSGRRVETSRFVINQRAHVSAPSAMAAPAEAAAVERGAARGTAATTVTSASQNGDRPNRRGSIREDKLDALEKGTVKFSEADDTQRRAQPTLGPATGELSEAGEGESENYSESDTGDPEALFDFISWSVENHQADHYMVILCGHGSGFEEEFLRDENSKGTLSISELGKVFAAVRSKLKTRDGNPLVIDVLGMDSCLMSMAEVCYELHGNVKYMVSTESYGPQSGWPYRSILERLDETIQEKGDATAEQLASIVVDEHVDFYVEYTLTDGLSVDISMLDVEKANDFAAEVNKLSVALTEELSEGRSEFLDQIVLAHWEAQSYNGEKFVDLFDFCDCLLKRYGLASVPEALPGDTQAAARREQEVKSRGKIKERCEDMMKLIDGTLVRRSCYTGITYQYSYGVSIYFPWAEVSPDYTPKNLKFVETSGWREFLTAYVEATRRKPRGYEIDDRSFAKLKEDEVRKTPIDGRGPDNIIVQSMRNPPIDVVWGGLSICTRGRKGALEVIEELILNPQ